MNCYLTNTFIHQNLKIRTVKLPITAENVQKIAWKISIYFDPIGNDFNLSCLCVYHDGSYYRVYIR